MTEIDRLMRDERPGAVLNPSDDSFHSPVTDDPFWTETSWYSAWVPERRLSILIYPVFRANLGMCAAGVYVWDDSGQHLHNIRYGAVQYYLPMPTDDLTHLRLGLGDGLEFQTIEPLRHYRVGYRDADFAIDLDIHGLHEPYAMRRGGEGHLEQLCHVTGRLRLDGEEIGIDRVTLRDRSWSVRSDTAALRGSFTYGTNGRGEVLQVSTVVDGTNVTGGWRLVNNEVVGIVKGTRTVERSEGRPTRIVLDVVDELGNHVQATGDCVNSFIWQTTARIFAWMSLVHWTIDGKEAWGEDQDAWSLDQLQLAFRQEREGTASRDLIVAVWPVTVAMRTHSHPDQRTCLNKAADEIRQPQIEIESNLLRYGFKLREQQLSYGQSDISPAEQSN